MSKIAYQVFRQSTHESHKASGLPDGWISVTIDNVADLNPPKPPKNILSPDAPVTFVPMPAVEAYSGTINAPEIRPFGNVKKGFTSFRENDVIFAKITPCMENGKAAITRNLINGLGFGSTEFHVLRSNEAVIPDYLFYYIRQKSFRKDAENEMTGSVGQKRVPVSFLKNASFPLPPLAEQKRIVAKIEELLARIIEVRERLGRAREILRRFRQSVINAACAGRLTADWRENKPNVTPVETTIRDLIRLRKNQLELENSPVKKYRTQKKQNTDNLATVPEGWRYVISDALFSIVTSGSRGWAKHYAKSGPLFIRIGNLDHDTITLDLSEVTHVNPPAGAEKKRTRVQAGDILISITADIGMVALVPDGIGEAYINQHVAISRPVEGINRPFLAWTITSQGVGQAQFQDLKHGATKIGLELDDIKSIMIPLPPIEEQKEIVRRVESLFKLADAIEKRVTATGVRAEKMIQAILAKAFRGELVPTEAELARREGRSFESAPSLLAKIKGQRKDTKH